MMDNDEIEKWIKKIDDKYDELWELAVQNESAINTLFADFNKFKKKNFDGVI